MSVEKDLPMVTSLSPPIPSWKDWKLQLTWWGHRVEALNEQREKKWVTTHLY